MAATLLMTAALTTGCDSPTDRAAAYAVRARAALDGGRYGAAVLEARNALRIEPASADAHYVLARAAEHDRRLPEAVSHLRSAIAADPSHVAARVRLGLFHARAGDWRQAGALAAEALKLEPGSADAHLLQARVLASRGDRHGARAEIATALHLQPRFLDAVLLHAADVAESDPDQALRFLERQIPRFADPDARALRQLRVTLLDRLQRTDEVIREYRALIGTGPAAAHTLLELVDYLRTRRGDEAADAQLRAFVAANPGDQVLALALARQHERHGRTPQALSLYASVAAHGPGTPEGLDARTRTAALQIRSGETGTARQTLAGILADVPDHPEALLLRAGLRLAAHRPADAIADLRSVLRRQPDSAGALRLLANAYARTGDRTLATATYRRLLEVVPADVQARLDLALLLAGGGQQAEAERLVDEAIAQAPGSVTARTRRVELLLAAGNTSAALDEAHRVVRLRGGAAEGRFALGRVLEQLGRRDEAIDNYRRAWAADPAAAVNLEGLVRALAAAGRHGEAERLLKRVLARKPDRADARLLIAGVAARLGRTADAQRHLGVLLAARPDSEAGWLASALLHPPRSAQRIAVLEDAMRALPGNGAIGMELAAGYQAAGLPEEAIRIYQALVAARPGRTAAVNNLAMLLLDARSDEGSWRRALQLLSPYADSREPALLDTLGWARYRARDFQRAIRSLEEAAAASAGNPVPHYHLGMAYYQAGDTARARQALATSLRLAGDFPGHEEAKSTLEALQGRG